MSLLLRPPLPTDSPWTLAALGRPAFAIAVAGDPAAQGSKAYVGHRTRMTKSGPKSMAVLTEQSKATKPWREQIAAAALAATRTDWVALDGPLVMDLVVSRARPASAVKSRRAVPDTRPDLDKYARAALDALGENTKHLGRPIIAEDARVVAFRRLDKVYERDALDPDSLRQPGAILRLWRVPAAMLELPSAVA